MTPTVDDLRAAYDAWCEEQDQFDLNPRNVWSIRHMAPLPPILAEYAVVSRDHLDKLEADHAEVAQLRSRLEQTEAALKTAQKDVLKFRRAAAVAESGQFSAESQLDLYKVREERSILEARLAEGRPQITLHREDGMTRLVQIEAHGHLIEARVFHERTDERGLRIDDALGVRSETVLA